MPYKDRWGDKAKARYLKRKESGYFISYSRNRRKTISEEKKKLGTLYIKKFRNLNRDDFHSLKTECSRCGYNKCKQALHYHHLNPKEKKGGVGVIAREYGIQSKRFKDEVAKCILLCANCHSEIEWEGK